MARHVIERCLCLHSMSPAITLTSPPRTAKVGQPTSTISTISGLIAEGKRKEIAFLPQQSSPLLRHEPGFCPVVKGKCGGQKKKQWKNRVPHFMITTHSITPRQTKKKHQQKEMLFHRHSACLSIRGPALSPHAEMLISGPCNVFGTVSSFLPTSNGDP